MTSNGGSVLHEYLGQATLAAEFRAGALATFATGDVAALLARIDGVTFGLSLCALFASR